MADRVDNFSYMFCFLGRVITRDLVHFVDHSPGFKMLLQKEVKMSVVASHPILTISAGMFCFPVELSIFCILTAASTKSRRV